MSIATATAFRMGRNTTEGHVFIRIKNGNIYSHNLHHFDRPLAERMAKRIADNGYRVHLKHWTLVRRAK